MNKEGAKPSCCERQGIKALIIVLWIFCVVASLRLNAAPRNSGLTVLPAEAAPIAVTIGSTPNSQDFVDFIVLNAGPGTLKWAAKVDTHWIELSTSGGVLRRDQEAATVTARVRDVSRFDVGRYTANVVFTSLTRNLPPVSRAVVLHVGLPAPVLLPQPAFSAQTTNLVAWTPVTGANQYELQISTSPQFASPVSSGWLDYATNYLVTNLQPGVTHFYRVRCRTNYVAWSQTLGKEFSQNANSDVSTLTSPGDLVLAGNTNRIWVEDFDAPGTNWAGTIFNDSSHAPPDPGYGRGQQDDMSRAPDGHPPLPINRGGDQEGHLAYGDFGHRYAYVTNVHENQLQDVTVDAYVGCSRAAGWIEAGVVLRGNPSGFGYDANVVMLNDDYHWLRFGYISNGIGFGLGFFNPNISFPAESPEATYHLRFSARGDEIAAKVWSVIATNGIIRESPVRFLGNGTNILSVKDSRYSSGIVGLSGVKSSVSRFITDYAFFDDITIQAHEFPPHYRARGSTTATVQKPNWIEQWGELQWTADTGPKTEFTVDVLGENGDLVATNVANGTDLNSIPAIAGKRHLRLRANLSTADFSESPALSDWTLTFREPAENPTASVWSSVVHSTPDITPPVLTITSPEEGFVTMTNVITITGTAFDDVSGVASVRVAAGSVIAAALTTNAFTNWTINVALLSPGTNLIRVAAQDNAQPTNFTRIRRLVFLAQ